MGAGTQREDLHTEGTSTKVSGGTTLTIYVENNYEKKACNHTNPANSPQSRTERKPAITPMQQTAHNHIFTTTKRKPAITTIQQIARNHVRKESLQSHQCNKQPTITYGKTACNHTNPTNSPQSHTHTNIKLLAIQYG